MYQQSIYKINYDLLKKRGIKCLLFDLDNTMVPYKTDMPDKKIKELFAYLENDFKIIILSNAKKNRVRYFKEHLNVDSAYLSLKPLKKKYKKILKLYHYKESEIACIGDQLMTDILGGNRMNMITIYVNPLNNYEPFRTKINRFIERIIMKKLNKKGLLEKGKYYE